MSDKQNEDLRPDPQALLKETKSNSRGKLKLFLGAAPGVGKTYAMLTEAREKRKEGLDVIIGWVDTHGRKDTEALVKGLELVPRLKVVINGHTYEKLDVQSIIKRSPVTVIIDEMPHSNPPGSLHKKRWQDIDEILDVGINVYSALNIQHLESLNGVVSRVTGVEVTETVPDSIFDRADEVRLVDLPPDDLVLRLESGKIYLPEIVARAKKNYFKKSNLIALRELTLRFMAKRIDTQIKLHRQISSRRDIDDMAFGLLLVLEHLTSHDAIRQASRIARALSSPWHCVWIERADLSDEEKDTTGAMLEFAHSLGANTDILIGDYAHCVFDYASTHNLSIIAVVPKSPWHLAKRRRQLRQYAPELYLLTLSSEIKDRSLAEKIKKFFEKKKFTHRGVWQVLLGNLALTAAIIPLSQFLQQANLVMFYLLLTLFFSVRYGTLAASVSAVLSVLCFDLSLVHPRGSFAVQDIQYLITFAAMLVVGLVAARLVAHRQDMSREANIRERQTRMLYDAAKALSPVIDEASAFNIVARIFVRGMAIQCEFWRYYDEDNELIRHQTILKNVDQAIIRWCIDHKKNAGMGTHTLSQSPYLYMPINTSDRTQWVAVLQLTDKRQWADLTSRRMIQALLSLLSQALERLDSVEEARQTLMNMEAERLRHSLIQSLSHDLRTPLTSLMANAESLLSKIRKKDFFSSEEEAKALVESSQRIVRLMSNLLEMARLQSNEIVLKKDWIPAEELIGITKNYLKDRLRDFNVITKIHPDCPFLYGDPVLLERILTNLLDNASKYCPKGSTILIEVKKRGDKATLSVSDNGPGIPQKDSPQRLFDPFRRGQKESKITGFGLGLAIAKTIARIHDADLLVVPSSLGGACFVLALPIVDLPEMEDEDEILSKEKKEEDKIEGNGNIGG